MSKKVLGIIAPIGITVIVVGLLIGLAFASGNITNDGWAALGIVIIGLFVYVIVLFLSLIIGSYLHLKKANEFGLGLLIGTVVLMGSGLLLMLVGYLMS